MSTLRKLTVLDLFELAASIYVEYLDDPTCARYHHEMTILVEQERKGELKPGWVRDCMIDMAIASVGNGLTREEIEE